MPNPPEYGIMYISNEQCQNRNSKNCLLAEHIFAGTILIERLPGSQEICDFLDVYCEIRARKSGKPEVFWIFVGAYCNK